MHTYLIELLICPACHEALGWEITAEANGRIEQGEARCQGCGAAYPIRDGIGLFLTPDMPRNDLWEQAASGLMEHLEQNPKIKRQLQETPPEDLAPADRYYRSELIEASGDYRLAQAVEDSANRDLYTADHMRCWQLQMDWVIDQLAQELGHIVDLASGKCYLVAQMARLLDRQIVATDFSPRILRRDRRYLEAFDLYDRVSLLAFDSRRTPFADGAVPNLTTNLGLPNIEEPGALLQELRRIVSGRFMAISHFIPENDTVNAGMIRQYGLAVTLFHDPALAMFAEARFPATVQNACLADELPTPVGVLVEGAQIDGLPVAPTTFEWCTLLARPLPACGD